MIVDFKDIILTAWGCTGMIMWVVTQLRLTRVEERVSKRVVKAAEDTKQAAIDSVLGMEKRVDAATERMESTISAKLDDFEIPDLDIGPLLDPLTERLNLVIDMKMKSMKGEEQNAVRRFLEEQGVSLEQAASEAEAIMLSRLTDQQLALRKFATMKIPPAIKANHPEWAALINEVRPLAVDLIQRRVMGNVVQGHASSASGFNPGV